MDQVASILQRANRNKLDTLNILTYPTHERYASSMQHINAIFYLWQGEGIKTWESKYAPLPKNHILLNPKFGEKQLMDYLVPDIIFSQNKLAHYSISAKLANKYKVPLINLEHCLPWTGINKQQMEQLFRMQGSVNIFITDYSRRAWGFDESNSVVIEHGVDTELFKPQETEKEFDILVVVNDFINRSWCCGYDIFSEITKNSSFNCKIVGNTPGLSEPASSVEELIQFYRKSKIFLSTAKVSPIPFSLLEAMSCEVPPVCFKQAMVAEVIKHEYNGMISDNPNKLKQYCTELLMNEDMRKELGKNARRTILERFNLSRFVSQWEQVFRSVI